MEGDGILADVNIFHYSETLPFNLQILLWINRWWRILNAYIAMYVHTYYFYYVLICLWFRILLIQDLWTNFNRIMYWFLWKSNFENHLRKVPKHIFAYMFPNSASEFHYKIFNIFSNICELFNIRLFQVRGSKSKNFK